MAYDIPTWIQRGRLRWVWALWEPRQFYRRCAHTSATSPGNALWMDRWYDRMHSEEMVAKLADMGINLVSTYYYKGFGLRAEAGEMEDAARFAALCHTYGIRVLGYHQWATLCYETFLDEVPQAEDWVQRDAAGNLVLYSGSTYWRWLGCQQHEAYVHYLRAVVRKCLVEARMDGIEWDGTVYKCHCALCQERFREYLQTTYSESQLRDILGLPHARHVRIPTTEVGKDPLYQCLTDFRRAFMAERLADFNALIKGIDPEAAQVTYDMYAAPGEPPADIDILVDENHDFPFVDATQLTSKSRGLKHGLAQGRVVLSTAWLRAPSAKVTTPAGPPDFADEATLAAFAFPAGGLRKPETAREVCRDLAETAMYGGHLITPTWALRPAGGDRATWENPELREPLQRYLAFFREHEALYDIDRSLAAVAILRSRYAVTHDFFNCYPCVVGMEQVCLQHQIPYDMVFSYQMDLLPRYAVLVLAEQTCLSDAEVAAILRYVAGGGGLVLTGRSGLYDEHFRVRERHPLQSILSHPRVRVLAGNPERLSRPLRDHPPAYHDMTLPARAGEIAAAIRRASGAPFPCQVVGVKPLPYLGTEIHRLRSGRTALHLLNYADELPVQGLSIVVASWATRLEVALLSPDSNPVEQRIPCRNGRVEVPELNTYAVMVPPEP